jgi:glutathione-regulated potassium-efflux system protein KefB
MTEHASPGGMLVPVLVFLAAAVVAVPLFRFLRLGAVIGYLVAGLAIGPAGFGLIGETATISHVAELGVVLLLFIIGLELEPQRLIAMRRDILILGSLQMAVTASVLALGLHYGLGIGARGAVLAGLALAFSSTAIAIQLLQERGALESSYGRRAFAVLLMQDVLVAPVLAIIPLLAGGSSGTFSEGLIAFAGAVAAFAVVILAGRYVLNPFFAILARAGAREVMAAAALLVVLGAAVLMQAAGLSMALGAFLAGLLLSESNFRHQLEADIEPFRGLLMGLFFMSVGMAIDGKLVMANLGFLAIAAILLVAAKGVVAFALMRVSGSRTCDSISGASTLTTAGEFAFVVFPVAMAAGLLTATQAGLLSALTALTMIVGPLSAKALDVLASRVKPDGENLPAEEVPEEARGQILVIGFGRFGQLAVQVLMAGRANVTVIDNDIGRIRNAARFGFKVFYGDGTRLDVLRAAGGGPGAHYCHLHRQTRRGDPHS